MFNGNVCHSHIQESNNYPLLFDTQKPGKRKANQETANLAFYAWMLNESPVRNFILNDDVENLAHGGAIIDCQKAGPSITLWICKSFRAMVEDQHRVPIWHDLVQRDVHPMLAWCVAQCVNESLLRQYMTTHCSVFLPPATKAQVTGLFIDHLPVSETGLKGATYDDWETVEVFPGGGGETLLPLSVEGTVVRTPDGWGGFIEKRVGANIEDLAKALVKLQKEYVK